MGSPSWLSIGDAKRKKGIAPIRRRYFGISDLSFHGAVYAPNAPGVRFHVGLVDPDGNVLFATRADKRPLKPEVPDGYGFSLPVPYDWLTPAETPRLFQFRILETDELFPDEARELPAERLLRKKDQKTEAGTAVLARLRHLGEEIADKIGPKTLVAGTHDMTRTGAPMILLEIIKHLRARHGYETVLLSLGPGDALTPEFERHSLVVIDNLAQAYKSSILETKAFLVGLAEMFDRPIALINSLCSTRLAEACGEAGFEVRSLIHEYPYAFGPDWIRRHMRAASAMVMPCEDVRDSYVEEGYAPAGDGEEGPTMSILPQGCYLLEKDPLGAAELEAFAEAFRRENKIGPDDRVVVSCGTLDSRKSFDWFAALARHHAKTAGGAPVTHFLWVGRVAEEQLLFHAEHDLKKLGLAGRLHHLDEVEDVRFALGLADVFLLCSRIDPFPSVVLESFMMGLPVIGFDSGQGSRDMIRETGFGTVVPYLDLDAAVRAIDELAGGSWKRDRVRARGMGFVRDRFLYRDYVDALAGWLFRGEALGELEPASVRYSAAAGSDVLPPVMLVGFHRSGTSYLSQYLQSIGVNMKPSGQFLAGGKGNPDGHFEDLGVLEYQCDLMWDRHGGFMDRWGGRRCIFLPDYPTNWSKYVPETRAFFDHLAQPEPWGWKDPRTLLFVGLWGKVAKGAVKVLALRHPLEIFLSLIRRRTDPYFFANPLALFEAYEGYHRRALRDFEKNPDRWFVFPMPPSAGALESLRGFLSDQLGTELGGPADLGFFDPSQFHRLEIPEAVHAEFRAHFPEAAAIHDRFAGADADVLDAGGSPSTPAEKLAWLDTALSAMTGAEFDLHRKLQEGMLGLDHHLKR